MLMDYLNPLTALVYYVLAIAGMILVIIPRVLKVSKALQKHVGRRWWNFIFAMLCAFFLCMGGITLWINVQEYRRSQQMLEAILPLFEQAIEQQQEEPSDDQQPEAD